MDRCAARSQDAVERDRGGPRGCAPDALQAAAREQASKQAASPGAGRPASVRVAAPCGPAAERLALVGAAFFGAVLGDGAGCPVGGRLVLGGAMGCPDSGRSVFAGAAVGGVAFGCAAFGGA